MVRTSVIIPTHRRPHLLPKDYPSRLVYVECASRLQAIQRALRAKAHDPVAPFDHWRSCIADNYRGRIRGLDFWDIYYYYTCKKGINLAEKAPYYHEAFTKHVLSRQVALILCL